MKKLNFTKLLMAVMVLVVMACEDNGETSPQELTREEILQRFYESTIVSSRVPQITNDRVTLSGSIDDMAEGITLKYGYAIMPQDGTGARTEVILGRTDRIRDIRVDLDDLPRDQEIGFCLLVAPEFRDDDLLDDGDDELGDIIESEFQVFTWENQ